jgi:NADPH:quinone reductase
MSRIVRFHKFGDASVLKLEEVPEQTLQSNELLIKVDAIGLNRAEVLFREGKYLERPPSFPSGIGYEASGVVAAVGSDVKDFKVGDKVSTIPAFSMAKYGVYGETAIVPVSAVASYPKNLSAEEGTSIWMQYLTAYGALIEYARIKKGDFVLITAASSSVGLAAIQLTRAAGAIPIATTRTAKKKQVLLDAGAEAVIITDEENLPQRMQSITKGHGADVVYDPVAGAYLETLAEATADGGTIFVYGLLSSGPTPFPLIPALKKGLKVQGYTLFEITRDREKLERAIKYVYTGIEKGILKPIIAKVFPLDKIVDAHRYMESNQQLGKIVVKV